jgi:hypothetical protein
LIGQFFATTLQFLSVSDTVHVLQMYQSDSIRQSIFDEAFGETMFLPQIRPSGIFPAATYASAYSVLLTLHLLSARNEKSWVFVLAGTHLAMLGSTAGLLLIIGSLPLALKVQPRARHLILSYLCALVLYKLLIPLRFDYNFSFGDIWVSVTSRLEANYIGGESLLQIDFLAFIGISLFLLLTASFTVFLRKLTASPRLITFSIATMMPILIHDISKSIFYWFLLGLALESLLRQVHSGLPKNVSTIRA